MSEKIFKILFNDKNAAKIKLDSNSFLSDIRIKLKDKLKQDFEFIDKENFPLDKDLESETKLNEIETDSTINLQSLNKNEIKEEIKINVNRKIEPLPEAKLIKKGKLDIYQYPIIKLTPLEESKAAIVLIVGQTGSGKSTFINAFVNYLMDIELSDNFRYSLINEEERVKN